MGRTSVVVPLVELRGAERLGDEVAVLAVLLAVHADDELAHELADVVHVDGGGERLVVPERGVGVLELRDLEEGARPHHVGADAHYRAFRPTQLRPTPRTAGP